MRTQLAVRWAGAPGSVAASTRSEASAAKEGSSVPSKAPAWAPRRDLCECR